MYVTDSRGSVYALDAADGHHLWTYDVTDLLGGGQEAGYTFRHRGVCYANGVIYSAAGSFIFALDAETGEPIQGFGENGQASVIPRRAQAAVPGRRDGDLNGVLVHIGPPDPTTACSMSGPRAARAASQAVICWRSMQ